MADLTAQDPADYIVYMWLNLMNKRPWFQQRRQGRVIRIEDYNDFKADSLEFKDKLWVQKGKLQMRSCVLHSRCWSGSSTDSKDASMIQASVDSDVSQLEFSSKEIPGYGQGNQTHTSTRDLPFKEKGDSSRMKNQNIIKGASYQVQHCGNLSTVHPMKSQEEDGNGYDSGHDNGITSSFEFHRVDRTLQNSVMGPFSRHVPSKWNDAEKWLVNRQAMNQNLIKKTSQHQVGRQIIYSWGRIAPESVIADQKNPALLATDTKRIDSMNLASQNVVEKFSFVPQINSVAANGISIMPRVKEEQNDEELSISDALTA